LIEDVAGGGTVFFDNVAVLGVGLIGASLARALKEKGLCKTIGGYGRSEDNLRRAKERGIIDDYGIDAGKVCGVADLIVLATPVGLFKDILQEVRGSLRKGAIVTDVGSVKRIVYEVEPLMPGGTYYVGSHPIAGGDRSGIDDARADLFTNAQCIITPTEGSHQGSVETITSLWRALGCKVEFMTPSQHDEIYAAVSHLPHIVAYNLINAVEEFHKGCIAYAGQGFKDTTRIALSSPELWRDISVLNRDNLITLIGILREHLGRMEEMLGSGDEGGIENEFTKAKKLRTELLFEGQSSGHDTGQHRSEVQDSVIAEREL
jgi:prephenate dehydrogenase